MLVCADWVLPISRRPIRDGAVRVDQGRIVAVGKASEFDTIPGEDVRRFPGCVLMPGLVNAHTHLALTALEGLLPSEDFADWLPEVVASVSDWRHDDYAASASLGAKKCLLAGVTVVGDIVYGPESVAAAYDNGLGGVYYWEVLGVEGDRLPAELERLEFPVLTGGECGPRVRCGLSPHSVYTAGPGLLTAAAEAARELGAPFAIHVAESSAETQLLKNGTGPLAETAQRMAKGFEAPGTGPVTYLDRIGAIDGATAVHLGQALPTEIPRLAATVRGVVTCPRSNQYLHNSTPKVERFLHRGIPVGVGTDSAASNADLDLMSEVRALHAAEPDIPKRTLIEMATAMGAIAIGVEDRFGILEPGMQADLAIFSVGETGDAEAAVIRSAGTATASAVMTAGVWRVLDGKLTAPEAANAAAATTAAKRASRSLERKRAE